MHNNAPRRGITHARVRRAGEDEALVTLDDWHHGQILAHVPAEVLEDVCPRALWLLPETDFTVSADLGALDEQDLDLHGWCVHLPLHRPRDAAPATSHHPPRTLRHAV